MVGVGPQIGPPPRRGWSRRTWRRWACRRTPSSLRCPTVSPRCSIGCSSARIRSSTGPHTEHNPHRAPSPAVHCRLSVHRVWLQVFDAHGAAQTLELNHAPELFCRGDEGVARRTSNLRLARAVVRVLACAHTLGLHKQCRGVSSRRGQPTEVATTQQLKLAHSRNFNETGNQPNKLVKNCDLLPCR